MQRAQTGTPRPIVAHDGGRLQPLCALLPLQLREHLNEYIDSGKRKVKDWILTLEPSIVDFSDQSNNFANINTPADLARLS
jgi:molybdopterin-guanine dinucleotide biosynthesis protein A